MRVLLFGASGMIGSGVLRECLLAPEVSEVIAVVRRPLGRREPKLREIVHADFADFSRLDFAGVDACFYCLGVSSTGMTEEAYTKVTYDTTMAVAKVLEAQSPGATFVFVSGAGTSNEKTAMWSRVKARAEDALAAMPFKGFFFRPGYIQPKHGARSRTFLYRLSYIIAWPFTPLIKLIGGDSITDTERVGLAMLECATRGAPKPHLQNRDINALAAKRRAG
jgi:uncharacterized protein YbjT (DUF2867 family)